jgi:hypothetical protein
VKNKLILFPAVLIAGLLGGVTFRTARAAGPISGVPTDVQFHGVGSPYAGGGSLDVIVAGTTFWAQPSSAINPSCSANAQSTDTVKTIASLAQAAMLAGKQLRIQYNVCGGLNYMNVVELLQ